MAMKQTLNLTQSQRLTLTPQLKQSLKLLQLSSVDLENEIQQCLDTNPLLERDDQISQKNEFEQVKSNETAQQNNAIETNLDSDLVDYDDSTYQQQQAENSSPTQEFVSSWEDNTSNNNIDRSTSNNLNSSSHTEFTQFISKQETLFEHLDWQIQMTTLSKKDKIIAQSILHSLDQEGYLTIELSEITDMFDPELEVELDEVNAVLSLIKTLEPIGVGARNLSERLSIFLGRMPSHTPGIDVALDIIKNHLDLLANHNINKLKRVLSIDDQSLTSALNLITGLNPRIATEFKSDQLDYIVPDIIVKQVNEQWQAFINPDNQSKLRINELYANMLKSKIDDADTEYIQANLQQAKMFIKRLMSRYDTLLLVSKTIIERQQDFFRHGPHAMQPMVLQDIATELDMHESTISRATSGKYLLSSRGVYELKYFFSSSLNSTDGSTSSSVAIRSLIKKMIEHEPKNKPLSDSKMATMLEQEGHIVARRTVAKYRESLQIASSSQRKSLT